MNNDDALPAGTRVGDFEIRRVIGWGGSGIVYEAYDPGLDRVVALKELFLAGHARRNGVEVEPAKPSSVTVCDAGKARFLREARLLAMLHERASGTASLVIVHRVLQQNRTAYMAMKLYSGETLRTVISRDASRVTQSWLISLLLKLLDALEALHGVPGEYLVHRDVSPDNIILQPDGVPVLLDFGATRSTKGEITAMIFKPGFSPIEQYTDNYPQGPWTDLYALCGVAYYAICGQAPDEAAARLAGKQMVAAVERGKGRFARDFLAVIDQGLNLLPWDRFLDVPAMRTALRALPHFEDLREVTVAATAPLLDDNGWQPTQLQPSILRSDDAMITVPVAEHDIPTIQQALRAGEPDLFAIEPSTTPPSAHPSSLATAPLTGAQSSQQRVTTKSVVWSPNKVPDTVTPGAAAARSAQTWIVIGLSAALALLALLWGLRTLRSAGPSSPLPSGVQGTAATNSQGSGPSNPTTPTSNTTSTTTPATTPATTPGTTSGTSPGTAPTPTLMPTLMPTPPAVVAPTPAANPVAGLDCNESNASWACVVAGLARVKPAAGGLDFSISPSIAKPGERLQVAATSATGGYLYLYSIDDHAGARAEMLFPNSRDRNNQMLPGIGVQLPRPNWQLELQPPVGRVWIVAVVTREPLNAGPGAERPLLPVAVQAFGQGQPMRTLGWPACNAGQRGCPEAMAISTTEMTIR